MVKEFDIAKDPEPTRIPTPPPTSAPLVAKLGSTKDPDDAVDNVEPPPLPPPSRRGDAFIDLVVEYMGVSSVECVELNKAINSRAMADESAAEANTTFDNILDMASNYRGSAAVLKSIAFAEDAHQEVLEASINAGWATSQTESYCQTAHWASTNEDRDAFFGHADDAAGQVAMFAASARNGLYVLKEVRIALSQFIAVVTSDGSGTGGIEETLLQQGQELAEKIEQLKAGIEEIDTEVGLTTDRTLLASLGREKEILLKEEGELKELLATNEEILSEQIEVKKGIFEQEFRPNYDFEEPLQFILKSYGQEKKGVASWARTDEEEGSKEAWFGRFGTLVVDEVPRRLMLVFNETSGGCIAENTILEVMVNLTEVPIWSTFGTAVCFEQTLTPGLIPDATE